MNGTRSEAFGELTFVDPGEVEFNLKEDPGDKKSALVVQNGKLTFLIILGYPVTGTCADETVIKFDEYTPIESKVFCCGSSFPAAIVRTILLPLLLDLHSLANQSRVRNVNVPGFSQTLLLLVLLINRLFDKHAWPGTHYDFWRRFSNSCFWKTAVLVTVETEDASVLTSDHKANHVTQAVET